MLLRFTIAPPDDGGPPSDATPTPRIEAPPLHALQKGSGRPESADRIEPLRAAFEAAPLPIVALDQSGIVTLWNPAAERMFESPASEVIGRRAPPDFVELCARALRGETTTGEPLTHQRDDGTTVDVRVSIAPLRHPNEEPYGVVALFAPV
jgi:PAS domain S-box-containing protein